MYWARGGREGDWQKCESYLTLCIDFCESLNYHRYNDYADFSSKMELAALLQWYVAAVAMNYTLDCYIGVTVAYNAPT